MRPATRSSLNQDIRLENHSSGLIIVGNNRLHSVSNRISLIDGFGSGILIKTRLYDRMSRWMLFIGYFHNSQMETTEDVLEELRCSSTGIRLFIIITVLQQSTSNFFWVIAINSCLQCMQVTIFWNCFALFNILHKNIFTMFK